MNVIIDERKENAMTFNKVLLSWIVILIITTSIYLFWQLGDINDVFKGILRKDSPCYVPKVKVEVPYIIDIIHKAGGLAVMAHPKLVTSDEYVLEMLNYDFDGMEVYHTKHNDDDVKRYKALAKEHNLFITGGSDYHGIPGKAPDKFGDYLVSSENVSEFISLL